MSSNFVGIDVGTGSARAGVFDARGMLLGVAKHDIALYRESGGIAEQSSNDIWRAVCRSVREALRMADVGSDSIRGVGFDATCSLVVLGRDGIPLPVGGSGDTERNIIVWMDHRAVEQAHRINATRHPVLRYVGGAISPEMETPKLLWLSENMPDTFLRAWQFMDLTDFLTWRASGSLARSVCTVTCKWTYLAHEGRWDSGYFRSIGLEELANEAFARIGAEIVPAGTALGAGLTAEAAEELNLNPGTSVGAGLIDAHAGGIGTVGGSGGAGRLETRMAYVFGTSACTMSSTKEPVFVPGVWGPYHSAMVPGLWLNEGGQSAAGAAIDHLVQHHPAAAAATLEASAASLGLAAWLAMEAQRRGGAAAVRELTGSFLVVPEFLGNRAPFADPDAKAIVAGLSMDSDVESLIALYLAGMCGLGYGARQIIEAQLDKGIPIDTIVVSGGAGESRLARQVLADATGLAVTSSTSPEPVLLGASMLGAVAGGAFADVSSAMGAMSSLSHVYEPIPALRDWHSERYGLFCRLQDIGRDLTGSKSAAPAH